MNRRRVMMGAGLMAMAGISALAAPGFFTHNRNEGKVTLRCRILEYNEKVASYASADKVREDVTNIMGEFFKLGMDYDHCVKILKENDMTVDEFYENTPDPRTSDPVFFDKSIVSLLKINTLNIFINLNYRIILNFNNNNLHYWRGVLVGSGP